MMELIRFLKKYIMLFVLFPLRFLPIKSNRVFLYNDLGQKYSDNPKAVAETLINDYPQKFQIVYPLKDVSNFFALKEKGIIPVKPRTFQYFYYAMTSKVFLTNSGGYSYLPLKKTQYVINTWHGGGAYKKDGIYMYENTRLFRKDLMLSSKKTSVFISSSGRFTDITSDSMLISKTVFWEIGMPRNDILIHTDSVYRSKIRKKIGLADDEKLVLYAPTYRKPDDNYFKQSIGIDYGIDPKRVCLALKKDLAESGDFLSDFTL